MKRHIPKICLAIGFIVILTLSGHAVHAQTNEGHTIPGPVNVRVQVCDDDDHPQCAHSTGYPRITMKYANTDVAGYADDDGFFFLEGLPDPQENQITMTACCGRYCGFTDDPIFEDSPSNTIRWDAVCPPPSPPSPGPFRVRVQVCEDWAPGADGRQMCFDPVGSAGVKIQYSGNTFEKLSNLGGTAYFNGPLSQDDPILVTITVCQPDRGKCVEHVSDLTAGSTGLGTVIRLSGVDIFLPIAR